MTTRPTRLRLAALAALCVVSLAACSSSPSTDEVPAEGLIPVTYLTSFIQNGVYSPFSYGISKGYFAQEGIDLKVTYGTGSSGTVQQVSQGQAQIGDAFTGSIAQGNASGADLRGFGFFRANGGFAFFCDKSLNITSFSQLAGHSVIIPPGTVQAALYPGVLAAAGLAKDSITVDNVAPAAAGAAYAGGQSDCITQTLGDAPTFVPRRASTTLLWSDGGFSVPGFAFMSTNSYLQANPTILEGFLRATYRSIAESLDDPAAAVSAFTDANPEANPELSEAQFSASKTVFCTTEMAEQNVKIGFQLPEMWATIVDQMREYSDLPDTVDAASL